MNDTCSNLPTAQEPFLVLSSAGFTWGEPFSLQQAVPQALLSRVSAFDDFGSYITIPAGVILAVPVASSLGMQTVATIGGVLFVAIALLPLSVRFIRKMTPESLSS